MLTLCAFLGFPMKTRPMLRPRLEDSLFPDGC